MCAKKAFARAWINGVLHETGSSAKLAVKKSRGLETEILPDGSEEEKRFPFHSDDMRFHYIAEDHKLQSNAVVLCIMDTSGSMGTVKKYLARSFYFLLYQFVRLKYQEVELVFIAHHTEAKEVPEQEFFHKVESGGTYISSGYLKALEIINARYHPSLWEYLRLPLLGRRQFLQ